MKINKGDLVFTQSDGINENSMIGIGKVIAILNPKQHNYKRPYRVKCNGKIYHFNKKDLYLFEYEK